MRKRRQRRLAARLERAEALFDLAHEGVVIDGAGSDDDHPVRRILPLEEAPQLLRGERANRFGRAQDGPAERLVPERGLGEAVEDDVVGRIVRRADLLQDDMLLALQLILVEFRIHQNVGEDVDRERHVVLQDAREERRRLDARRGIDLAADILDVGRDLPRRALARALEGHVFEQMGDAVLVVAFVARARLDPDSE